MEKILVTLDNRECQVPMLILLFDGAPSVPKETHTPASIISLIGANPSIRIAAAGQWDTFTPALESKAT